jgi:hypothetical protein
VSSQRRGPKQDAEEEGDGDGGENLAAEKGCKNGDDGDDPDADGAGFGGSSCKRMHRNG